MNGVVSLLQLPDNEDTVRLLLPPLLPLLLLLLLLFDPDKVDMLDLEDDPDSDPDPDLDPADLVVCPVFEVRSDFAVRPDLDVRPDFDEMSDTSVLPDLDDSSEIEDTLVLELIFDTVDRAVEALVVSGSGAGWMAITLERERDIFVKHKTVQPQTVY